MSESRLRAFVRLTWRSILVLALAGAFGFWLMRCGSRPRRATTESTTPVAEIQPPAERWAPRKTQEPAPGCTPEATRTCLDGDVWFVDSCGQPHAQAQECGARRCIAGACEIDTGCGDVTAFGRCQRDLAQICQREKLFEVDCSAKKQHCVMTGEGPTCRESSADDCRDGAPSTCEGRTLKQCREGKWTKFDCDALGGVCVPGTRAKPGRCVYALPVLDADCGACGCPPEPAPEVCDGKDNDGNGAIDDDAPCGAVPIVAFVVAGQDGNYSDEDIQIAIDETNTAFTRTDDLGLTFEIKSIVRFDDDELRELDIDDLDKLLRSDRLVIESEDFYIPVVFTDVVLAAGVPRPGMSTVPNGMCGGLRRIWDRQPPVGFVAMAKRRWPTTLAHEVGHFLGLCHTHEAPAPVEQVEAGTDALTDAPACREDCDAGPDGICDTSTDPGPEQCGTDAECAIHCATGDRPDPGNMMAYYPECRLTFSEEQALLMREVLALRRGWHACLEGACVCDPAASQCPAQMSCRPFGADTTTWQCDLDGPALPGGKCEGGSECGGGSICVHTPLGEGRCARTCGAEPLPSCTCQPITTPVVDVCGEDLRMAG